MRATQRRRPCALQRGAAWRTCLRRSTLGRSGARSNPPARGPSILIAKLFRPYQPNNGAVKNPSREQTLRHRTTFGSRRDTRLPLPSPPSVVRLLQEYLQSPTHLRISHCWRLICHKPQWCSTFSTLYVCLGRYVHASLALPRQGTGACAYLASSPSLKTYANATELITKRYGGQPACRGRHRQYHRPAPRRYVRSHTQCLPSVRGSRPGKPVHLEEYEIKYLCLTARDIFINQPILLELEAPIKICGTWLQTYP